MINKLVYTALVVLSTTTTALANWNYYECQIAGIYGESINNHPRELRAEENPYSTIYNGEGSWVYASALGGVDLSIAGFRTVYAATKAEVYNDNVTGDPLVSDPDYALTHIIKKDFIDAKLMYAGQGTINMTLAVPGEDIHAYTLDYDTKYSTEYMASMFTSTGPNVNNQLNQTMVPDVSDAYSDPGIFGTSTGYTDTVRFGFHESIVITKKPLSEYKDQGYGIRFKNFIQCANRA